MKTINDLVNDHRPIKPFERISVYLLKWIVLSGLVITMTYLIFPLRPDLAEVANGFLFHLENVLWLTLAICSGIALYDSSFPDNRRQFYGSISVLLLTFLFFLSFYHNGFSLSLREAAEEMSLWKGRCGFIITFLALLEILALAWWAKRGASTNPHATAFWASLSSSALACFLMQVVCFHSNTLHLIIWHFIPLGLFCYFTQRIVGKKLAW